MNLIEAAKNIAKATYCTGLTATEKAALFLSAVPVPNAAGMVAKLARNAHLSACEGDPENVPQPATPPQFTGGQCVGSRYIVEANVNFDDPQGGAWLTSLGGVFAGKIGAITFEVGVGLRVAYRDGLGTVAYPTLPPNNRPVKVGYVNVYPAPIYGDPDNCGNPPATLPSAQSEIEKNLADLSYLGAGGIALSLIGGKIKYFKPCLNLDGARIPFEISKGDIKICGKIGVSPSVTQGGDVSIDIDICPSDKEDLKDLLPENAANYFTLGNWIGNGSSVPETGFGGTQNTVFDSNQDPILGIFIAAQKIGNSQPQTVLIKDNNDPYPTLIIPRIGFVRFEYLIQKETGFESSFSEDIPIKQAEQFIPCPWQFGAISVHINWAKGWQGQYRHALRKSCCDACKKNGDKIADSKGNPLDLIDRCRID